MPNQPSDLKSFIAATLRNDFVILDTETTGLDSRAEICDLAIVTPQGDILFSELIKPVGLIRPDASRVTGITNEMVADRLTWWDRLPQIKELLTGKKIVTWNATFDRKMFHQSDEQANLPSPRWGEISQWYCAMTAFGERFGEWNDWHGNYKWQKLITGANFYHVTPIGELHRAIADALTTALVIKEMRTDVVSLVSGDNTGGDEIPWDSIPGFPAPRARQK